MYSAQATHTLSLTCCSLSFSQCQVCVHRPFSSHAYLARKGALRNGDGYFIELALAAGSLHHVRTATALHLHGFAPTSLGGGSPELVAERRVAALQLLQYLGHYLRAGGVTRHVHVEWPSSPSSKSRRTHRYLSARHDSYSSRAGERERGGLQVSFCGCFCGARITRA